MSISVKEFMPSLMNKNENDFLIYEEQISSKNNNELQSNDNLSGYIELSNLSSKSFKRGTFVWICKKVNEEINKKLIQGAYHSFLKLFGEDYLPQWTKRVTPQEGDIVFSYEATLNLYAIIPKNFYGSLGRRMAVIRPDTSKVNTKYLFYYLKA